MIGLDTNVLIRYLVQDDPVQSPKATRLIESLTATDQGFVSVVTMTEVYWVLRRSYKLDRESAAHNLQGLLDSAELVVGSSEVIRSALALLAEGADFADALISELGGQAGCSYTATFDRFASKVVGMQLLD